MRPPPARAPAPRATRARLFVVVVVAALAVAAAARAPRRDEQAAMLAGEGRHSAAVAMLERRLAAAPGDPDVLAALGRSLAALGEVSRAVDAFDAYLAARPDDDAARERQAELLLRSGRIDRYLAALARVAAAHPTPVRVTRLVELYRLHGRTGDEVAALETFAATGALDPAQLERLGALLAVRGDLSRARAWLARADAAAPPEASEGRLLLVEVAIATGAADTLDARMQAWLAGWRSPWLAGRLLLRLARAGEAREAARLAAAYADIDPDGALALGLYLASKGSPDPARAILERWSARGRSPDVRSLHTFVGLAARLDDPSDALRMLVRLTKDGASAPLRAQFAEDFVDGFGAPALASVRPLLSAEVLAARPLFAAGIALADGDPDAARRRLRRVDPAEMPPEAVAAWLSLSRRLGMEPEAWARLVRRPGGARAAARVALRLPEVAPGFAPAAREPDQVPAGP